MLIPIIAGVTLAGAGTAVCYKGIPVESGKMGGLPVLIEWRVRWACWRWIAETRKLDTRARPADWTDWTIAASVSTRALAKAAAIATAGAQLSPAAVRAGVSNTPPGFVKISAKKL